MKVWNEEIKNCGDCPYVESYNREWTCEYDEHEITTGFNLDIDEDCPFDKPITRNVIETFGFTIIKELDYNIKGQLSPENPFKFYELDYDLDDNELIIEEFSQGKMLGQSMDKNTFDSRIIFEGVIDNPEELKFILISLNIIK